MPAQFWVAVIRAVIRDGLLEASGAVSPAAMSRWQSGNSCLMKKILLVLHNCDAFFASRLIGWAYNSCILVNF